MKRAFHEWLEARDLSDDEARGALARIVTARPARRWALMLALPGTAAVVVMAVLLLARPPRPPAKAAGAEMEIFVHVTSDPDDRPTSLSLSIVRSD